MADREDRSRPAKHPPGGDARSRRRRLGSAWRELPLEKKLSVAIIPLATTLIATLVPIFLLGGGQKSSPRKQEGLEAAGISVRNGPDAPPQLDILLRNAGDVVSVLDRVEFRLLTFRVLERDRCAIGGAEIPPSRRYELALPAESGQGRVVSLDTPRQLRPNEAEDIRLRASLDNENPATVWLSEDATLQGQSRLFRLDVLIYHDGESEPIHGGQALLAVPFPYERLFWTLPGYPGAEACRDHNRRALKAVLSLPGKRSEELVRFSRDPDQPVRPGQRPTRADKEAALAVAQRFWDLFIKGDATAACRLMSWSAQGNVADGSRDCPNALMSMLTSPGVARSTLRTARFRISTDFGSVITKVHVPGAKAFVISLHRARQWVVDSFDQAG